MCNQINPTGPVPPKPVPQNVGPGCSRIFFPTLTCLGTDSQTTGAAKQGQEVAAMTWVSSKTQNMDLTEPWEKVQIFRREWRVLTTAGCVVWGYSTSPKFRWKTCGLVAGGEVLKCWWRGVVTLRQKTVKSAVNWRGHVSSQQVPLNQGGLVLVAGATSMNGFWVADDAGVLCRKRTAGIRNLKMMVSRRNLWKQWSLYCQPKQCIVIREIPQNYHNCLLLDSPKKGNLMTPGQMGFIFRFHAFGGVPICTSPQSRSIFVKFLGGSVRFVVVLGG